MVVLDTHVWFWWVETPNRLSASIRAALAAAEAEATIVVSVASIWELAIKAATGRLRLALEIKAWIERAARYPGVLIEPIGDEDAIASTQLPRPLLHGDPFDRLLIALSRRVDAPLLTVDRKLVEYPHVVTIH